MPNHVIRDRIWVSKKLAKCSLKAALAYPWIYLVCDDWGRFEYEPSVIWKQVFARRDDVSLEEFEGWLDEYQTHGLLQRYHMDGDLAFWTGFYRGGKRRPSAYPDPAQFLGEKVVADLRESATEKVVVQTKRNETERNETEGAVALVALYNETFGANIKCEGGNEEAAKRALAYGYTVERAAVAFKAIQDKSTTSAAWCADNCHKFEYLVRPTYKHHKTQALTLGPIEKIENELASKKPEIAMGGSGEAARISQALAEKAARKAANG